MNELDSNPSYNPEEKCDPKCDLCVETPSNCTQCIPGLFRQPEPPCNCLEGYHDNDSTTQNCQKCPYLCKKW